MDESDAISLAETSLKEHGIDDAVEAVGWFYPRGHTAAGFAGGMVGSDIGDELGAGGVGVVAGYSAATHGADAASGLPAKTFVAVSESHVYLLEGERDGAMVPGSLFATLARGDLDVKVHQRVNVRVLELIDRETGSKYELEGSRVPMTHSGEVIKVLNGS